MPEVEIGVVAGHALDRACCVVVDGDYEKCGEIQETWNDEHRVVVHLRRILPRNHR